MYIIIIVGLVWTFCIYASMSGTETQTAMPGATGPASFILAFCEVFMSQPFNVPVISRYVSVSGWC